MEIILVELADKAGEVAMFEMFGQDGFRKAFVLHWGGSDHLLALAALDRRRVFASHLEHDEAISFVTPSHHRRIGRIFEHSSCVPSARGCLSPLSQADAMSSAFFLGGFG